MERVDLRLKYRRLTAQAIALAKAEVGYYTEVLHYRQMEFDRVCKEAGVSDFVKSMTLSCARRSLGSAARQRTLKY